VHRLLPLAIGLAACQSGSGGAPDARGDLARGDRSATDQRSADGHRAPILTSSHAGWKQPGCEACHKLPEKGHTASRPPECAACHGGDGACAPNGSGSTRTNHGKADDCLGCHGKKHGFPAASDCVACHFASAGVVDCPARADAGPLPDLARKEAGAPVDGGGAPKLSAAVTTNCYNWPAQEFSSSNKAPWANQIKTGALAVELTLKDVGGAPTTLSTLLASKPVWLQFGSFT
jgi:hypothetical protein